jgi:signal recognition particle receptor subunit alpha
LHLYSRKCSSAGGFWSSLSSLVGNKTLTRADIEPVLEKMKDHLISKNVAAEVSVKLCESVSNNLEGKVLGKNIQGDPIFLDHPVFNNF